MFGVESGIWVVLGLMTVTVLLLMGVLAKMFRKAGPNEALIVYGFRGTRVVRGHGTIIFPMIEASRELSLELMFFDVAPQQDLYTKQGVAVTVEAVARIKVKSDRESVETAAEQFLSETPAEREGLIRLVMEGHLRGIIGQLTVEEIVKQPEMVADRMRATCAADMNKMGLEVVSFTIKEVRDKNEYITNQQVEDQKSEVESLKHALQTLEQKLTEAQSKSELLIARHRRARVMKNVSEGRAALQAGGAAGTLDRMKRKVAQEEAIGWAWAEISTDTLEDRFAVLEKEHKIEKLLTELKSRRRELPAVGEVPEATGSDGSDESSG